MVRSTVECKDGTLWVATTAGVDSIDRKSHKVTRHAAFRHGSFRVEPRSSRITREFCGWPTAGAYGTGLATIDRAANTLTHYRLIPQGEKASAGAKAMYEDADGNLWVASSMGGLYKLDPGRTQFVRYRNNPI